MSTILAINAKSHDSGVAIVRDGRLVVAALEERFTRVKHHVAVPARSLEACLSWAGISPDEIDHVVIPFSDRLLARRGRRGLVEAAVRAPTGLVSAAKYAYPHLSMVSARGLRALYGSWVQEAFDPLTSKGPGNAGMHFAPHHEAHAMHALSFSGARDAAVLVVDGQGEMTGTTTYQARDGRLAKISDEPSSNSLGFFYSGVTQHLGWERHEGEGKTMGLAPYGRDAPPVPVGRLLRRRKSGGWKVDPRVSDQLLDPRPFIERETGVPPRRERETDPLAAPYPAFAFAAQSALESALVDLARDAMAHEPSTLCLSGGVALNCKANGVVLREARPGRLYVPASAGDGGATIGAALWVARELGELQQGPVDHDAWGPADSEDEIAAMLDARRARYERPPDIASATADLLAQGKIVGWYQGRMEHGPRSLGHRAVLADPREVATRDRLNALKRRAAWRPLCPSILEEKAAEYIEDSTEAPFMIVGFNVIPARRKEIAAAVHVDGSTRPQTVSARTDPLYHRLISSFEGKAGVPAVLNTSFNLAGLPVVATPLHAWMDYHGMGLDALAIGPYLVRRDAV